MKRRAPMRAPTPEFSGIGLEDVFNLYGETTLDGERLLREAQAQARLKAEAEAFKRKRQRLLIFTGPLPEPS